MVTETEALRAQFERQCRGLDLSRNEDGVYTDEFVYVAWIHYREGYAQQPVRDLMNPWQRAIDEALIVNGLDCTHASESPEQALARLIRAEVDVALNLPADNSSTERPDMSQATEALKNNGRDVPLGEDV